jgi:hypothetical protein
MMEGFFELEENRGWSKYLAMVAFE